MTEARYALGAQNAWTEVLPAANPGKESTLTIDPNAVGTFEFAFGTAAPGGAGTAIAIGVANHILIPATATNVNIYVRNTATGGGGQFVIDDLNVTTGKVFIAT